MLSSIFYSEICSMDLIAKCLKNDRYFMNMKTGLLIWQSKQADESQLAENGCGSELKASASLGLNFDQFQTDKTYGIQLVDQYFKGGEYSGPSYQIISRVFDKNYCEIAKRFYGTLSLKKGRKNRMCSSCRALPSVFHKGEITRIENNGIFRTCPGCNTAVQIVDYFGVYTKKDFDARIALSRFRAVTALFQVATTFKDKCELAPKKTLFYRGMKEPYERRPGISSWSTEKNVAWAFLPATGGSLVEMHSDSVLEVRDINKLKAEMGYCVFYS